MNSCFRSFFVVTALLPLASCDKTTPQVVSAAPQAVQNTAETENQLVEARDALQRQALEIETKTALMDKQLAEMEQALKNRDNAELRTSLDALKQQNDTLRVQAEAARRQSNAITPRVTVTPQVSIPRDYTMFYECLAPFGRWMDVSGYGYCWRPTLVGAQGWRPYVDGCWVWSSLGWTWQSNEPFGWAVYHYGRWVNLSRYGWVWVPGSDWAPAWVAWRQSRDYIGWAPLPPDRGSWSGVYRDCDSHYNLGPTSYVFITTNHFVRPSYTTVCAPVVRNTTIFQSSVNNTQIVRRNDHAHGNVFVHHGGPPRAQMEHASGAPVPQRQVNVTADAPPPREHGHREAAPQLAIVELPAARADAPPVRPHNAEHIDQPKLVSGFEGVPQRAAAEIRETIAEEKATAVVQQQPVPMTTPPAVPHQRHEQPATHETVRPAIAVSEQPVIEPVSPPVVMPAVTASVAVADPVPAVLMAPPLKDTIEPKAPENSVPVAVQPQTAPAITTPVEVMKPEQPTVVVAPVVEPAKTPKVEKVVPSSSAVEKMAAEQAAAANAAIEAEKARVQPVEQQAQTAAMQQRQQQEAQERLAAEKMAADQAAAVAEAEKARIQAAAVQQQEALAAEQAAAENAKARQQAEAAAMQQQQEQLAAQQRAAAERMAAEQAAVEAEKARQQAEAAAMQRQQEEAARRAAEEQQMRIAQQEAESRAQEMAQRQAEEQARRAAEEQMRAQQEAAQRAAQEMAQRQAEEAGRRAQEEAQRAAAEAAARAAAEAARNQPQPAPPGQ